MKDSYQGVFTVATTPFDMQGNPDVPNAKKHLDWLIENGIHGICILGATGEYQSVSDSTHKRYVEEIVPYIRDRVTVVVGTTRERPDDVVDLIQTCKASGAHAAMVLPPFYCHPTQEEIVAHYQYISDRVDFPIVVYNNPGSAGVCIEQPTFQTIAAIKNVQAIKESAGDIRDITSLVLNMPDEVAVLCGCDNLAYESFASGAVGWVSMAANFAPKDCVALYDSIVRQKDLTLAREIYRRLLPALNILETFPKPVQAIKYVLSNKCSIPAGTVARPRLELAEEEIKYIVNRMEIDQIR